ncbi:hypothetical protein ABZY44_32390 [Streptomyces sp. NPDC006544]|uniref:hypothetical protein n=1 Tax=Streptomyces sp. NPDC006544 TaxID=3154583 RepID=UPI0033B66810
MSTPEEQQRQYMEQQHQLQQQQQQQEQHQQSDPYGTQTWQSPTWDTSYQPVQAPLEGVPAQHPMAPEGWFRDEAPGPDQVQAPAQAPDPGQEWARPQQQSSPQPSPYADPYAAPAAPAYRQTAAPDHWFREEPQAQAQAPAPAQQQPYQEQPYQQPQWGETAYLPPYPGPDDQAQPLARPQAPAPAQDWADPAAPLLPREAVPAEVPQAAPAAPFAEEAAGGPGESGGPGEEPAYSPPTLAGNTLRAVDPAQARAEGRSPIIDPGPQAAILTAALGLVIAAAAALGRLALLAPLIALQGLTAAGWFRLNGMWPARQGIALAFAGALVADAAVLAVDDAHGPGAIIGTLGAWVLLTLVMQLRSHADPDERMYGLMASVASAALAIVCAGYLAAGSAAASVGAAAVAVAVFARALPLPTAASVGVSLAAGAGAGIAVGGLTSVGAGGALIGLAAGACALIGLRVAAYDYPSKFVHMTAGVALPLAAAAPAVYLIGRVVG